MLVVCCVLLSLFFFKQKTAYEMRSSDWSSDVCSSDLAKFDICHVLQHVCQIPRVPIGFGFDFGKVASCLPLDLTEVLAGPCDITHVEMVAAEDYRLGRRYSPSEVVRRIGDGFHDGNGIGVAALQPHHVRPSPLHERMAPPKHTPRAPRVPRPTRDGQPHP